MFANTSSEKVCGLMEMRVAPYSRMTASFSASVQSGRPASTVYSTMAERSKQSRTVPHELAQLRCREAGGGAAADVDAAEHQPALSASSRMASTSLHRQST